MAAEQVEDSDLWVESEIARQLQTVSLEDDNSDVEVENELNVSPDVEPPRRGGLLLILDSYRESLEVQLEHGAGDGDEKLLLADQVFDKSSSSPLPTVGPDGGRGSSHGNIMLPPAGHEASSLPSSLQETLDRLEEEGQKKADDLSRELTIRETAINTMIQEAERHRREQEEMMALRIAQMRTRAAITLQSYWRGHWARQCYDRELHRMRERRLLEEEEEEEERARWRRQEEARCKAAILIQSVWRGCYQRHKFGAVLREHRCEGERRRVLAAVTLQSHWRGRRARRLYCVELGRRRKEEELMRRKKEMAAIWFQSFWRGYLVRSSVVPALRKQREMAQRDMTRRKAAVVVQRYWRKYITTKRASMKNRLSLPTLPSSTVEILLCDVAPPTLPAAESSRDHDQTTPLSPLSPPTSLPSSDDIVRRSSDPRRRKLTLKRRLQSALMVLSQPTEQSSQAPPFPAGQSSQALPLPVIQANHTSSPAVQVAMALEPNGLHGNVNSMSPPKSGEQLRREGNGTVVGSVLDPGQSNLSPRGSTLSPRGSTLSPKGSTLSPRGSTLSPRGSTLSPRGSTLSLPCPKLHITRSTPSFSPAKNTAGAWETSSSSSTPSVLPPSTTRITPPTPHSQAPPSASGGGVCPAEVAIGEELSAMSSLHRARKQEEGVAESLRSMMGQLVSKETLAMEARSKRSKSSHALELEHFSVPFSPQAWLGLVEERRVKWSKAHIAWREPAAKVRTGGTKERTGDCTKKPLPRSEARPLSELQLLSASPPGTEPSEVLQVSIFRSQSPVDLTCLSRCSKLQLLTLNKCAISSIRGVASCSQLVELNLQANILEQVVDLCFLDNIRFVDLSGNRLTSLTGLEDCPGLLELNVSENRITKITGLSSLSRLQRLALDNNLLVNSGGLETLPSLRHLSCIGNHLPRVTNLTSSPLLQCLSLQQNNLCEAPPLMNHVLLRELWLEENNLSDVQVLTSSWLPLLQNLSLANNSISSLDSLSLMLSLETLDIRNNSLCDLPLLLHTLRGCFSLTSLVLEGNPLTEDPRWRKHVQGVLPSLLNLNDEEVTRPKQLSFPAEVKNYPLYQMCRRQLKEQDDLTAHHNQELQTLVNSNNGSPEAVTNLLNSKVRHHEEWRSLLVRHLQEHEMFGDERNIGIRSKAATTIQAVWRGRRVRGEVAVLRALRSRQTAAAAVIQAAWRSYRTRRVWSERRNRAAIVIQSHFKGYWLRKRLKEILDSARYEDSDEDGEYEGVLDLGYVDEALLERDVELVSLLEGERHSNVMSEPAGSIVGPGELTDLANGLQGPSVRSDAPLPHPSDGLTESESLTADACCVGSRDDITPSLRQQAWIEKDDASGHVLSAGDQGDHRGQQSSTTEGHNDRKERQELRPTGTGRAEAIAQEWGFRDLNTTELLLKRALRQRSLIAKANKRKRMEDPSVRLSCFRRSEHSLSTASEMSASTLQAAQQDKYHSPSDMTPGLVYQWTHSHRVVYREANPPPRRGSVEERSSHRASSKCSLPQLDSHVLAGYKTRLVSAKAMNSVVENRMHSSNKDVR